MQIDYNIWFYTLSSLAQVMVAVMALMGVFAVFKLNKLEDGISDFMDKVKSNISYIKEDGIGVLPYEQLSPKETLNKIDKLLPDYEKKFKAQSNLQNLINPEIFLKNKEILKSKLKQKHNICSKMTYSFIGTGFCVIFSLFFLMFGESLSLLKFRELWALLFLSLVAMVYTIISIIEIAKN